MNVHRRSHSLLCMDLTSRHVVPLTIALYEADYLNVAVLPGPPISQDRYNALLFSPRTNVCLSRHKPSAATADMQRPQSAPYMHHTLLTRRRSRDGFLQLPARELCRVPGRNSVGTSLHNVLASATWPLICWK